MKSRASALLLALSLTAGCGSGDPDETANVLDVDGLPPIRVVTGVVTGEATGGGVDASRRIAPGCDPVEAARAYEPLVDSRARATLHWDGASEQTAALEIPVYVVAIADGAVEIRFLQFPLREQYLHIWVGSGHIAPGPEDRFRLDPCSASLAAAP